MTATVRPAKTAIAAFSAGAKQDADAGKKLIVAPDADPPAASTDGDLPVPLKVSAIVTNKNAGGEERDRTPLMVNGNVSNRARHDVYG